MLHVLASCTDIKVKACELNRLSELNHQFYKEFMRQSYGCDEIIGVIT